MGVGESFFLAVTVLGRNKKLPQFEKLGCVCDTHTDTPVGEYKYISKEYK